MVTHHCCAMVVQRNFSNLKKKAICTLFLQPIVGRKYQLEYNQILIHSYPKYKDLVIKNVGIVSLLSVQRPKFFHMREDESGRIRNPLKYKPREPT